VSDERFTMATRTCAVFAASVAATALLILAAGDPEEPVPILAALLAPQADTSTANRTGNTDHQPDLT
jgi:hypothetical protein